MLENIYFQQHFCAELNMTKKVSMLSIAAQLQPGDLFVLKWYETDYGVCVFLHHRKHTFSAMCGGTMKRFYIYDSDINDAHCNITLIKAAT